MKIILVEREKSLADSLQGALNDLGYQCQTLDSSQGSGLAFKEVSPDLIVSTHSPPQIDALEILNQWHQFSPKSSLVIASPNIDIPLACQAVNSHIFALLPRTYELADLISLADRLDQLAHETKAKEEQHSRLALEYAKLKTAFEDLRRKQ